MDKFVTPNVDIKRKNILAPSKCTAYVSNLPFSLTNCDLHKIFVKYGRLIRVTVMKERKSRKSKGVAFLLYGDRESALNCVKSTDGCEMFGRTLRANIAKDNGKAAEFIKRREYPDKTRCYECGEGGHLSYACPKNILGEREPPPKKKKRKLKEFEHKNNKNEEGYKEEEEECGDSDYEFDDDSLSAAIRYQQELREGEEFLQSSVNTADAEIANQREKTNNQPAKKKVKPSAYFSDEDEVSD